MQPYHKPDYVRGILKGIFKVQIYPNITLVKGEKEGKMF